MARLDLNPKPVPQVLAAKQRTRRAMGHKGPVTIGRIRRQRLPLRVERELRSQYLRALRVARRLVKERLIPRLQEIQGRAVLTTRDRADVEPWPDTVKRIMADITTEFGPADASLETAAVTAANQTAAFNSASVSGQFKAALGLEVFAAEPRLAEMLSASVTENVSLIKSVPAQYFREVEDTVIRQFRTGQRASSISKEISQRFVVSERRAAFIARDQVSKLNGDLTRMRQIELGVPGYIWRTSLDERVRDDHADLEGTRQNWDRPPVVDQKTGRRAHPGGDFNCRCTAEPDLAKLTGDKPPA